MCKPLIHSIVNILNIYVTPLPLFLKFLFTEFYEQLTWNISSYEVWTVRDIYSPQLKSRCKPQPVPALKQPSRAVPSQRGRLLCPQSQHRKQFRSKAGNKKNEAKFDQSNFCIGAFYFLVGVGSSSITWSWKYHRNHVTLKSNIKFWCNLSQIFICKTISLKSQYSVLTWLLISLSKDTIILPCLNSTNSLLAEILNSYQLL